MDELKPSGKPFAISKWEVQEAYRRVKANQGAAGVDGCSLADYAKMEKALKNEARMKLVAAALSGTAGLRPDAEAIDQHGRNLYVENALEIADAAIRRITETA